MKKDIFQLITNYLNRTVVSGSGKQPTLIEREVFEAGSEGYALSNIAVNQEGNVSVLGQTFKAENIGSEDIVKQQKIYVVRAKETEPIKLEVIGQINPIEVKLTSEKVMIGSSLSFTLGEIKLIGDLGNLRAPIVVHAKAGDNTTVTPIYHFPLPPPQVGQYLDYQYESVDLVSTDYTTFTVRDKIKNEPVCWIGEFYLKSSAATQIGLVIRGLR